MPVRFAANVTREMLRANRETLFVFGDNEQRVGSGGQAAACRGEPNAVGVATKSSPSMREASFWSDADYERCCAVIDQDMKPLFEHVRGGGLVVFPAAGIGTGLADLPSRAPRVMEHIRRRCRELLRAGGPPAG